LNIRLWVQIQGVILALEENDLGMMVSILAGTSEHFGSAEHFSD